MDLDPSSNGARIVQSSNPVQPPNKGSPLKEGERRKRDENLSQKFDEEKGHPTPPYIGQGGGGATSLNFPCGTKPNGRGGGGTIWGVGPSLGAMGQGGRLPPPLMGLFRPICIFFHF